MAAEYEAMWHLEFIVETAEPSRRFIPNNNEFYGEVNVINQKMGDG
ncbi:hypothetical protein R4Z10_19360 [Niallia sp. XMNu-256]